MSDAFDDKLRRALRPVDPGESFTQDVLAKLPEAVAETVPVQRRKFGMRAIWAVTGALAASMTQRASVEADSLRRRAAQNERDWEDAIRLLEQLPKR